jgi:hypothetical protein
MDRVGKKGKKGIIISWNFKNVSDLMHGPNFFPGQ